MSSNLNAIAALRQLRQSQPQVPVAILETSPASGHRSVRLMGGNTIPVDPGLPPEQAVDAIIAALNRGVGI